MEIIGKFAKAKTVAFVFAIGFLAIGCVMKEPIEVETEPSDEPAWRSEIAAMTVQLQNKRKDILPQVNERLRGVHPKSIGCVDADFIVNNDIPDDYRVGLFETPGVRYRAKIRFSNADVLILKDLVGGENSSRGMAIKILDVGSPVMFMDGAAQNQDFLMINTPAFAFGNVRDYRRLSRVLLADEKGASPSLFFFPAVVDKLGPEIEGEPPEITGKRQFLVGAMEGSGLFEDFTLEDLEGTQNSLKVVGQIKADTVRNPLLAQYYSAAPFRYGPDRVMKFSVAPLGGKVPQDGFSPSEIEALSDDYLAAALKDSLTQGKETYLSFMIQLVGASQLAGREQDMIEDATFTWIEEEFPFVEVAQIVIRPLDTDVELVNACKALLFTPWHALAAHEPLGGINRLRRPVYSQSADCRRMADAANPALCRDAE